MKLKDTCDSCECCIDRQKIRSNKGALLMGRCCVSGSFVLVSAKACRWRKKLEKELNEYQNKRL